ncbi:MAG: hypothetical protein PVH95_03025 [Anaerolineae bacterium]|jgi:hypothetical protein
MVDRTSYRAEKDVSVAQNQQVGKLGAADTTVYPVLAVHSVVDAILQTLIYADLFDYPLKLQEIHRFLTGYAASLATIEEALSRHPVLCERTSSIGPFWFLAGRERLVGLREEREGFSQTLWCKARRYVWLMAAMPFLRMVSITGSLAMNNASSAQDDIDLLIVAAKGRVWLTRGLVILVVRLAERMSIELCPNYILSENYLHLDEPSLFIAHELAQLVPLYGLETYHRLLENNAWVIDYLPNALPLDASIDGIGGLRHGGQKLLEAALAGRVGDAVERWERERKIPRLLQTAEQRGGTEVIYTPNLCKGHVNDHASTVRDLYVERLAKYAPERSGER